MFSKNTCQNQTRGAESCFITMSWGVASCVRSTCSGASKLYLVVHALPGAVAAGTWPRARGIRGADVA